MERIGAEIPLRSFLSAQREVAACLKPTASLVGAAQGFLEVLCELFECEAGLIWDVGEGGVASLVCSWGRTGEIERGLARASREEPGALESGLPGRALSSGLIEWACAGEGGFDDPRAGAIGEAGIEAGVAVPVPIGSPRQVRAVVELFAAAATEVSEDGREMLLTFARQLDAYLEVGADPATERLRQHMAEVVRGSQNAVLSKDLSGIVTSWNPAAERLYGYSAEEAIGRHVSFIVPPDHKNEEMEILERVCRGERLDTYETERVRADGGRVAVSLTVSPIVSPAQGLVGASVIARDITLERRRRAAQDFLVAAGRRLDASLDFHETARTIVATAIPEMAEICVLDFVIDGHRAGDSIVAGVDREAAERLEEIRRDSPLDLDGDHPVAQVLRAGEPMVWHSLTDPDVVETVAQNDAHRELMRDAGYNSAAVVGLVARGRTLGALSFLHVHEDLRYDAEDLSFLAELGDRAAMALDNARLFEERDQIAEDLQRGLRPPEPPAVPGLEVSVIFEPVGAGIEVGGDFYDVIPTDDGCWLLIGDVAGKGSAAAAVSVAIRHAVRALSREIDDPQEILTLVNEQLREGRTLNHFATTELIRLRREDEGWTLDLAAAGHPPAIHQDGRGPRQLGGGSLLGAWEEPSIERHRTTLGSGETLVLSTDGWYEVGPPEAHRYPECLGSEIESRAGAGLEELTKALRADALERGSGELKDDLVLLAVRPE